MAKSSCAWAASPSDQRKVVSTSLSTAANSLTTGLAPAAASTIGFSRYVAVTPKDMRPGAVVPPPGKKRKRPGPACGQKVSASRHVDRRLSGVQVARALAHGAAANAAQAGRKAHL